MSRVFNKQILKDWIKTRGKGAKEELAYKLSVSTSYIDKLLRDDAPMPRVDLAQGLCSITETSFDELFPIKESKAA